MAIKQSDRFKFNSNPDHPFGWMFEEYCHYGECDKCRQVAPMGNGVAAAREKAEKAGFKFIRGKLLSDPMTLLCPDCNKDK